MLDAFIGEQKGKRYEYKIKHMRKASMATTPKGRVFPAETRYSPNGERWTEMKGRRRPYESLRSKTGNTCPTIIVADLS